MDIKARIEEVINQKGLTKKVVAERMGKFNQAFNSLLTNPKWETIELVATAIGISTQEMLFGIKPEQPEAQPADELPFSNEQQQETEKSPSVVTQGALICPHCGKPFTIEVKGI